MDGEIEAYWKHFSSIIFNILNILIMWQWNRHSAFTFADYV